MARYALIKNAAVINITTTDSTFIDAAILAGRIDEGVDLSNHPGVFVDIGYTYSDGAFSQSLASAKAAKLALFKAEIMAYRDGLFDRDTREAFRTLRDLALRDGLTNRLAYIDPLLDWADALVSYGAAVGAQIMGAGNLSALDAVSWDIPTNAGAVPNITPLGAAQITD